MQSAALAGARRRPDDDLDVAPERGEKFRAHYEVGRLRLPVVFVPALAALFSVSTDTLLSVTRASTGPSSGKRRPTPKLQRQLERLRRLPNAQQHVVLAMLDGVLQHG